MKYLKELCNVYWARPENALWLTKVMHEMDKIKFDGTKLDLMCGHGIWSFIKAGGKFDGKRDLLLLFSLSLSLILCPMCMHSVGCLALVTIGDFTLSAMRCFRYFLSCPLDSRECP